MKPKAAAAPKHASWKAYVLLAVFVIGGLAAPVVHRFEHVRDLRHSHGSAAQEFSASHLASVAHLYEELLVEERTKPHALDCELCARLGGYSAVLELSDAPPPSEGELHFDLRCALHDARSERLLSIRAPPTLA